MHIHCLKITTVWYTIFNYMCIVYLIIIEFPSLKYDLQRIKEYFFFSSPDPKLKFGLRSRSKQLQVIDLLSFFSWCINGIYAYIYTYIINIYAYNVDIYAYIAAIYAYIYEYIVAIYVYIVAIVYIYAYITNKFE